MSISMKLIKLLLSQTTSIREDYLRRIRRNCTVHTISNQSMKLQIVSNYMGYLIGIRDIKIAELKGMVNYVDRNLDSDSSL